MSFKKIRHYLKQLNYKVFFFAFILLYTVMPIVAQATSTFLTTYSYMMVVVAAVIYTFLACKLDRIRDYIFLLIPFIIYELLVMFNTNNSDILLAGYQILLFMLPVCLGFYLITHKFLVSTYTIFLIVIITITCITTNIGCLRNPEAARVLATISTSQDPTAVKYFWQNIGGYSFVYSIVLMYPFVILAYKMKRLHIVFTVIFAVLAFTVAIRSEYTYALMLLMLTTLLFFVKRDTPLKKFFLMLFGFLIIAAVFRVAIAALLARIGDAIGNQMMSDKMAVALLGTDSVSDFDDNRDKLYLMSLQNFLNNPLFGTLFKSRKVNGGHSFILDTLASYGAVGGMCLFFMYKGIYTRFYRPFSNKEGYCFVIWAFLQPLLLSTINTGMWLNNYCLFAPIFLCAIYGDDVYLKAIPKRSRSLRTGLRDTW